MVEGYLVPRSLFGLAQANPFLMLDLSIYSAKLV